MNVLDHLTEFKWGHIYEDSKGWLAETRFGKRDFAVLFYVDGVYYIVIERLHKKDNGSENWNPHLGYASYGKYFDEIVEELCLSNVYNEHRLGLR